MTERKRYGSRYLHEAETMMSRVTQEPDGTCRWECPIDTDYHRKSGRAGLLGILVVCAAVFFIFLIASEGSTAQHDVWIPFLVIGVILAAALPLVFIWNSAADPHERYEMTEDCVRSGYGKGSVCSEFKKTKAVTVSAKYIELIGTYRSNRVYVPPEDMDFVREYIITKLPKDTVIRYEDVP